MAVSNINHFWYRFINKNDKSYEFFELQSLTMLTVPEKIIQMESIEGARPIKVIKLEAQWNNGKGINNFTTQSEYLS